MTTITIRNLDENSFAALSELARQSRKTVEEQAAALLTQAVARGITRGQFLAAVDEIAAMTPQGIEQTDSVDLLREDRAR